MRESSRNPGQRISPVRRWLTYLTLFVASASIVGDLISLVVRFLSGDLTLRFGLKILVVAVLAGSVLYYYLQDLRRDEIAPSGEYRSPRSAKIVLAVLIIAVLMVIGFGFWTAGSPTKARLYARDNQRVSDLANICQRVQLYYQNKEVLPQSLNDCDTSPGTYINQKVDRVTGNAYLYRVIDATHFEVGATFDLPTPAGEASSSAGYIPILAQGPGFWEHGAGRKTFKVEATRLNTGRN